MFPLQEVWGRNERLLGPVGFSSRSLLKQHLESNAVWGKGEPVLSRASCDCCRFFLPHILSSLHVDKFQEQNKEPDLWALLHNPGSANFSRNEFNSGQKPPSALLRHKISSSQYDNMSLAGFHPTRPYLQTDT